MLNEKRNYENEAEEKEQKTKSYQESILSCWKKRLWKRSSKIVEKRTCNKISKWY